MTRLDNARNAQQENYYSNYYFKIKASKDTTIVRKTKAAAIKAYWYYHAEGKDLEWLGKWVGNQFEETNPPMLP